MHRKAFLKHCAALTAGVVCMDLLLPGCAALPYAAFTHDGNLAVVQKAALADQDFVLLDVETFPAPIYLGRTETGDYAAVLLRCTHRGCTVRPAGPVLQCPCHGSRYTPDGTVVEGPAPRNLRRFPVTETTDTLRIALTETMPSTTRPGL